MFGTILLVTFAVYFIGGRAIDGIAAAKGQPIPSHEKWIKRHGSKPPRGGTAFGRYCSQAADQAFTKTAERSRQRHERDMAWLRENEVRKSGRKLDRKRRSIQRRDRAAERFTTGRRSAGRGVKRAAVATGAGVAGAARAARPPRIPEIGAEQPQPDTDALTEDTEPGSHETSAEPGGTEHPGLGEEPDNAPERDNDATDDSTQVSPDVASAASDNHDSTFEGGEGTDHSAEPSNVTQIGPTAGNRSNTMTTAITGDTTTVEGARACVDATVTYADEIGSRFEDMAAQATQLHESVKATVGQLDGAIGGMTQAGVGGGLVAAFRQALDELADAGQQLEQVEQVAKQVGDASAGLKQAAQDASAALVKHESIAEQVQATDGVARDTAWYGARQHAAV